MYIVTGYDIAHSFCNHSTFFRLLICFSKTVVPDDDEDHQPFHAQTPPTPPVPHQTSPGPSPPPSPRPMRQRAMEQLRPVSIPNIVCGTAGHDPIQKIAAFDKHNMPDGHPADEAFSHESALGMERPQLRTGRTAGAGRWLLIAFGNWNTGIENLIAFDDEGPCRGIDLKIWELTKVRNLFCVY